VLPIVVALLKTTWELWISPKVCLISVMVASRWPKSWASCEVRAVNLKNL
jgi:hypothetical protein